MSAIVPRERGEGRGAAAVGVDEEVFKVFFLDRVLQRLAEQIIEGVHKEAFLKVFFQDRVSWAQRFVSRRNTPRLACGKSGVGLAVPLSDELEAIENISHIFFVHALLSLATWTSSTSPLCLAATCSCAHATVHGCFWKNFIRFLREGELRGPRCSHPKLDMDFNKLFIWRLAAVFFTVCSLCLRTPSIWTLSPGSQESF